MTHTQWVAEVCRRIAVYEGCQTQRYFDSAGIPTIGIGFNLQRADAAQALSACGVADVEAVIDGSGTLTQAQAQALFAYSLAPIEAQAAASLAQGTFDALTDARRFVICDLVYNLGLGDWLAFAPTRGLINYAQTEKNHGDEQAAHDSFVAAGAHLQASDWFAQVGQRAIDDVAMMVSGEWSPPLAYC